MQIALDYLDITLEDVKHELLGNGLGINTRAAKLKALAKFGIEVMPEQNPLNAWVLAMCRKNGLPEITPSTEIGDAAFQLCPRWVFWLA